MKFTIDTKKGAEVVSEFLQKTSEQGKKTIADVQAGAVAISEKSKQDSYQRRLKKYNPLFPDVYHSAEFNIPNMIVIRDDAERRGIDVCEGAIGWLGTVGGMEVLYLYDEAVAESGITFVPVASCDAVYYVDSHDRSRFIRTDCIFSKAHEERIAELKYVAHALGAKKCTIEISESSMEMAVSKRKAAIGGGAAVHGIKLSSNESAEQNVSQKNTAQRTGTVTATFEGCDTPKVPELKWFANEEIINKLIEMRCTGENSLKTETLQFSGASSATMSNKTACAIDNAMGALKAKGNSSMEAQAVRENCSTMIFSIEF